MPYVHQFNIALQRELQGNVAAQIAYVGILGREQLVNLPMNGRPLPDAATPVTQQPRLLSGVPTWAAVGNIGYRGNFGQRTFKGVQAVVERRFSGRWGGRVAYAWSKGEQHVPNTNFPYASVPAGANKFEDLLNVLTFEDSRTPDVVTHRMTLGMNYQLGFAEDATGFVGALAKGWQVNAIAVIQTGTPFTVTNLTARSNTGGGDRPNTIADPDLPGGRAHDHPLVQHGGVRGATDRYVRRHPAELGVGPRCGDRGPVLLQGLRPSRRPSASDTCRDLQPVQSRELHQPERPVRW